MAHRLKWQMLTSSNHRHYHCTCESYAVTTQLLLLPWSVCMYTSNVSACDAARRLLSQVRAQNRVRVRERVQVRVRLRVKVKVWDRVKVRVRVRVKGGKAPAKLRPPAWLTAPGSPPAGRPPCSW